MNAVKVERARRLVGPLPLGPLPARRRLRRARPLLPWECACVRARACACVRARVHSMRYYIVLVAAVDNVVVLFLLLLLLSLSLSLSVC